MARISLGRRAGRRRVPSTAPPSDRFARLDPKRDTRSPWWCSNAVATASCSSVTGSSASSTGWCRTRSTDGRSSRWSRAPRGSARRGCSPRRARRPAPPASWCSPPARATSSASLPFGVVRQLFEPVLADGARWLSGSAAAAARVFEPPDDERAAGDPSFGILYGLYWLTANIAAERPLLLAIDDLHWCDPASLRFIAYLERRLEGLRAFVATTLRTGHDSTLISEVAHDPASIAIPLPALSEAAVAELVRARLGADAQPAFCAACHRATGGNPLLLGELLKTLEAVGVRPDAAHADVIRDIGPRAVAHTVLLRLARLPEDAVAVATRDRGARRRRARCRRPPRWPGSTSSGSPRRRARSCARRSFAPSRRWASSTRSSATPCIASSRRSERELRHEQAAKVLRRAGGGAGARGGAPARRAVPRGPELSRRVLREAGQTASRRGDSESAISYLRRALAEPVPAEQRPQLLLELGLAEAGVDAPAAAEHMREAYEGSDGAGAARGRRSRARSGCCCSPGRRRRVSRSRSARWRTCRPSTPTRGGVMESFELYASAFGADVPGAAARLASIRAEPLGAGLGAKMLSIVAAWDWARRGGSADQCAGLALDALADGTLIAGGPRLHAGGGRRADRARRPRRGAGRLEAAMRAGRKRGGLRTVCLVNIWQGFDLAAARRARRGGGLAGRGLRADPAAGDQWRRDGLHRRVPHARARRAGRSDRGACRARSLRDSGPGIGRRHVRAARSDRAAAGREPLGRGRRPGRRVPRAARRRRQRRVGAVALAEGARARRTRRARGGGRAARGGARGRAALGSPRRARPYPAPARHGAHEPRGASGGASRSPTGRPRASSTRRRWRRWGSRCGGRGGPPRPASRCAAASRARAAAARSRWPSSRAQSSTPPAAARGARR